MLIESFNKVEQFEALRPDWEKVYAADPEADYFRSWSWLRAWMNETPRRWWILAARTHSASAPIGFFPVSEEPSNGTKLPHERALHTVGKNADYSGFLALPEHSEEVVCALAKGVRDRLAWDRFHIRDLLDSRAETFFQAFFGSGFRIEHVRSLPCYYIPLPRDWESFLSETLQRKVRQNLRRATRRLEGLDGFRLTQVDGDTLDRHIDILFEMWQRRWGSKPASMLHRMRKMFHASFMNGDLYLQIAWQGGTPIGGRLGFLDRVKGSFLEYMSCFSEEFAYLSPGTALMGYSAREAIDRGFTHYDFLRGAEEYKASFGVGERFTQSFVVTRAGAGPWVRLTAGKLLRRVRRR